MYGDDVYDDRDILLGIMILSNQGDKNKENVKRQLVYLSKATIVHVNHAFGSFYYIDTSVLQENIPLVKFIKTTSETQVVYFP